MGDGAWALLTIAVAIASFRMGMLKASRPSTVIERLVEPSATAHVSVPTSKRQGHTATLSDDHDLGPVIAKGAAGETRTFEYADAHGEITIRTIVNWTEHARYIRGVCTTRHASRTFRKDRVLAWSPA